MKKEGVELEGTKKRIRDLLRENTDIDRLDKNRV